MIRLSRAGKDRAGKNRTYEGRVSGIVLSEQQVRREQKREGQGGKREEGDGREEREWGGELTRSGAKKKRKEE